MHSDAYTLCNLDSQTYSTLPVSPYHHHHHHHHQSYPVAPAAAYHRQHTAADSYFAAPAADCFRSGWATASGHVIDSTSGGSGGGGEGVCAKPRSRAAGFYGGGDHGGGAAAMVLYGHQTAAAAVPRPSAAAFDFPFPPGFCAAGAAAADVASSGSAVSGCGGGYPAFYDAAGVLQRSSRDYDAAAATTTTPLFYAAAGYADLHHHQPPSSSSATNGQASLELCGGGEFGALCGSAAQTAVSASNRGHARLAESNCTSAGVAAGSTQNSGGGGATYKWMTVKRGAPKSSGQPPLRSRRFRREIFV